MKIKRPIISILIFAFLMLAAMPSYAGGLSPPTTHREQQIGTLIAGTIGVVVAILYILILDESESSEMSDESIGLDKLSLNMKIGLGYSDQDNYRGESLKNLSPMLQIKLRF